ncbi:MAG: hypothetical protein DMD25_09685 [Gemmatimonadetes bacterium]|nr:MAG: hypothetical protein DMD25_09685 [Gemmatimonadota bacterium]
MPIRGEGDRAAPIGPEHRDAVSREPLEHLGRRVAVVIVPAHADHRFARRQLVEPRVRRRGLRAVMAHLQHLHPTHGPRQPALDRQPGIGLEQQPHRAVPDPQHHAVLVHLERQPKPERVWAQHLEHDAVHLDPVPCARRVPPRARCLDAREKLQIQRSAQRLPRLEHQLRVECLHNGREPTQMIGIAVGRHDHGDPPHALAPQEGDHHPPPRVALRGPGAAVDHDPAAVGGP